MTDFVDPFDELDDSEGATVTGERPTASGSTAVTASASVADKAEASEMPNEVRETTYVPNEGTHRPPQIIKTPEDVPAALDRLKIDREWLLRRAGKKK